MIIKYEIVVNRSLQEFERTVNDLIQKGWQPLGGLSMIPETDATNSAFGQAMVKYAQDYGVEYG